MRWLQGIVVAMKSGRHNNSSSRWHGVGCPYIINEKTCWRLNCLVEQNWQQPVVQLTDEYNAGLSRSVSEYIVEWILLDMRLYSSHSCYESLLTKHYHYLCLQWTRGILKDLPGQMNHDSWFSMLIVLSGYGMLFSSQTVAQHMS